VGEPRQHPSAAGARQSDEIRSAGEDRPLYENGRGLASLTAASPGGDRARRSKGEEPLVTGQTTTQASPGPFDNRRPRLPNLHELRAAHVAARRCQRRHKTQKGVSARPTKKAKPTTTRTPRSRGRGTSRTAWHTMSASVGATQNAVVCRHRCFRCARTGMSQLQTSDKVVHACKSVRDPLPER
jgi:hypothetical protein